VRARQYADDITHAGVAAHLEVEHRVADAHDLVHARYAGRFHRAKDQERRGTAQCNFIAGDDRIGDPLTPADRVEYEIGGRPVETRVERHLYALCAQPFERVGRAPQSA
jgi:hypothetical protein